MLRRFSSIYGLMVLVAGFLIVAPAWSAQTAYTFDIPAQSLADALREVGKKTNTNILFEPALVKGLKAPALRAELTADEAVKHLLGGTELRGLRTSADTIVVRNGNVSIAGDSADAGSNNQSVRLARAEIGAVSLQKVGLRAAEGYDAQPSSGESSGDRSQQTHENEVVVTGSNIRGVVETAAPVQAFEVKQIEKAGYVTVEQFIQSLSQNFRAGVTEYGGSLNGSIRTNRASGTGINLRGLGNDSTLVLINGRRLAPSNNGENVDISMIPLSAVKRIDVLTDGASAIYGSEAVGGVVNFILRDDYQGAETRARYSQHTNGHARKYQVDQVLGTHWNSGRALLSVSISDRNPLGVKTREATRTQDASNDVIGGREDHAVLFSVSQTLSPRITLYTDGVYADRDFNVTYSSGGGFIVQKNTASAKQWNGLAGVSFELSDSWKLDVNGSVGRTETTNYYNMQYATFFIDPYLTARDVSKLNTVEVKADGALFSMPAGAARLALNAQYRDQVLDSPIKAYGIPGLTNDTNYFDVGDRNVKAVAAEIFLPLIGERSHIPLVRRLDLTVAGRVEEYDIFGRTEDPKFGMLWSPMEGLNLRSTWGTSFRAPLLGELTTITQGGSSTRVLTAPNDPGGQRVALFVSGNNPNITPETATSFTLGLDFTPGALPGAKLSLTYYDIDFRDRIAAPLGNSSFLDVFINENLYGSTITRAGQPGFQQLIDQFTTGPFFTNIAGVPISQIQAVIDNRLANVAVHRQSGLDYNIDYDFGTAIGDMHFAIAGTYIFEFGDQLTPLTSFEDTTSTVLSPIDFKVNTSLGWSKNRATVTATVNYADNYREARVAIPTPPNQGRIPSWTTVNLNASYDMKSSNEWLDGLSWSLSVNNLFDRMAPYVYGYGTSNFDGTNADVLGRYVSLGVSKSWR